MAKTWMTLGAVVGAMLSIAAGAPKKAVVSLPGWFDELKSLQSKIKQAHPKWHEQLGREAAIQTLQSLESPKGQLRWFDRAARGKSVAWALSLHMVDRDVPDGDLFIEHSNQSHASLESLAKNVRCYVDDDLAEKVAQIEAGTPLLCVGQLVDFHGLHNFMSISIRADTVKIGHTEIEAWIAEQQE
ncbi:MAG: hypothetical protein ACR2PA_06775 [Hyphomicrobiaceae bacterium]